MVILNDIYCPIVKIVVIDTFQIEIDDMFRFIYIEIVINGTEIENVLIKDGLVVESMLILMSM
jgi:formylmethanofuran:tetrahydromethanopterin formyltransferase